MRIPRIKATLPVIASIVVLAAVLAGPAFAHGGHHGKRHGDQRMGKQAFGYQYGHRWHRGGKVWLADLTPGGATGETGATANIAHHSGTRSETTGPTGDQTTGPAGKFIYAQRGWRYLWGLKVRGLAASTAYSVAIYTNTDGQGCASTTNTALTPSAPFTTNADGWALTGGIGTRKEFGGLSKKTAYYVKVTDANGAAVICGTLDRKTHRAHGRCDGTSPMSSESRHGGKHKHHRHHHH